MPASRRVGVAHAMLTSSSILAMACFVLISLASSTSAVSIPNDAMVSPLWLGKRHGDDEHNHEDMHSVASQAAAKAATSHSIATLEVDVGHADSSAAAASHHEHDSHMHHGPHPYDGVPSPAELGLKLVVVPSLPHGAGGHSHGHGGAPVLLELNETKLLRAKGPDPLSYIEWDFAYGLAGQHNDLFRFAEAYRSSEDAPWDNMMGVSGGRYRSLVDEVTLENRKEAIKDIQSRLGADRNDPGRHRFLMIFHIVGCIVSCFILLPAALALRAAKSSLAPLATLTYLVTLMGSMFCSVLYKALSPRLYPTNKHSSLGYAVFWMSIIALGGDVYKLLKQIFSALSTGRAGSKKLKLTEILTGNARFKDLSVEYDPMEEERMLSVEDSGTSDAKEVHTSVPSQPVRQNSTASSSGTHSPPRSVHFEEEDDVHRPRTNVWQMGAVSPSSTLLNTPRTSAIGELPLLSWSTQGGKQGDLKPSWHQAERQQTPHSRQPKSRFNTIRQALRYGQVTIARSVPVLSFAAAYTGLAVYTGSCRGPYQNTCLAHGIKGGIFFWYGLLSFGRYLGAYADLGWAWNKRPTSKKNGRASNYSAEWVECLVIFIYGATNTWMERFGAAPGDPYTVKQVQHISIAVMFWFAGLMGLILETDAIRRLLALPVTLRHADLVGNRNVTSQQADDVVRSHTAPPSYSFSFNPFPALVIGVTGIAMAAHHQDYEYEVSIHSLWGNLLAGFSVLRMLTYFFLWLRPPTSSVMPSRPPTEALASFSLTCGGLVFMLSSEEVSFVAMRNGFGDFMMIMNVTVAVVSLLFCLVAAMMVLKAWAVKREHARAVRSHTESLRETQSPIVHSSAFVVGEDDEEEEQRFQDEQRQRMTSSPEQV